MPNCVISPIGQINQWQAGQAIIYKPFSSNRAIIKTHVVRQVKHNLTECDPIIIMI